MSLFGILNIDKPPSWTSRAVVDQIQRLVRPAKIGHAGTLDPLATGVLLVLVGPATRLTDHAHRLPKRYRATFLVGQASPTDDTEGEITPLPDAPQPSTDDIVRALAQFIGEIQQRPPAHSAVKVQGRRAYKLARRGREVELAPRKVTIHRLELVRYDFPELVLDVECGSGTYIRALGRDLAESLGTAAVMSALVRTAIGPFHVEDALAVDDVTPKNLAEQLIPPIELLADLPRVVLTDDQIRDVQHGRYISFDVCDGDEFAAVDTHGQLVAILAPASRGYLRPLRNFTVAE